MATWYEAKDYAYNGEFVVPVEVVKVTAQMVTVIENGAGRYPSEPRRRSRVDFFETEIEAYTALIKRHTLKVQQLQSQLHDQKSKLGQFISKLTQLERLKEDNALTPPK